MDNRWSGVLFASVLQCVAYRTFQKAQAEVIGSKPGNHQPSPCFRDAESGRFVWTTGLCTVRSAIGNGERVFVGFIGRRRWFCTGSGLAALCTRIDEVSGDDAIGGHYTCICWWCAVHQIVGPVQDVHPPCGSSQKHLRDSGVATSGQIRPRYVHSV